MDKRHFIKASLLASLLLPLAHSSRAANTKNAKSLLPVALNKGDTIGVVCPSKAVDELLDVQIALEVISALGFSAKTGKHLNARRGYLAGTDAERASDINDMFADKMVKAIICLSGGSGAARLLPLLNYQLIRANPKAFMGYSDITALLNGIHAQTGLITFHGPNASGSWNPFMVEQFQRLFLARELMQYQNTIVTSDELVTRQNRTITLRGGKARGEIIGGNLTVITSIAGSPYLPDFTGKILFLEDTDEPPYSVDRMLNTLKLMGALDKIAGFIFGNCSDCRPGQGYGSLTLDEIFSDYLKPLNIPAYRGAMIGHIRQQFIVPVGGTVEMDADAGTFRLLMPVFQPQ